MTTAQQQDRFLFLNDEGEAVPFVPPRDKWELQYLMYLLFGMVISGTKVCPEHCAPLDALAASYFAEAPVVIWKASRGFGGKTTQLAGMAMLELMMGANINILGGSGRQSQRVHVVCALMPSLDIACPIAAS